MAEWCKHNGWEWNDSWKQTQAMWSHVAGISMLAKYWSKTNRDALANLGALHVLQWITNYVNRYGREGG